MKITPSPGFPFRHWARRQYTLFGLAFLNFFQYLFEMRKKTLEICVFIYLHRIPYCIQTLTRNLWDIRSLDRPDPITLRNGETYPIVHHIDVFKRCGHQGSRIRRTHSLRDLLDMDRRRGLPYRASWAFSGSKLWERVREMLDRDVPVILSIGPNFPLIWRKERLPFYSRRADGSFVRTSSAKSHYVTVTGMDDSWVQISSWGREFFINRQEYDAFVKQHSTPLFSNVMYVKRTDL